MSTEIRVSEQRDRAATATFTVTPRYRRYVLALLVAVGVVGWVDRNVFAVLLESVKRDLVLSDTQLGALGGLAFGVFYATVGLPVAWLADRYDRRRLIAVSVALWSGMTALCGAANGFAGLLLARMGVGIGEAGGSPPSQSLVADYFPPERRAFALGVLYLHIPLGFMIGYAAGAGLAERFGWRLAFAIVGLPGLALAVLVRLTLREPPRGFSDGRSASTDTPTLVSTLRAFLSCASLRHIAAAGAIHGTGAFAAAVWLPALLVRSHDLSITAVGALMALAYGLGGGIGVILGGALADRIVRLTGDPRWYTRGCAAAVAASLPCALLAYGAATTLVAGTALVLFALLNHLFLGPVTAQIQNLFAPRRRAVAAAVYLLLVNLISMGLGPLLVGIASDTLTPRLGDAALRYALALVVSATSVLAAFHFLRAGRTLAADLARVRRAS